MQSGNAIGVPAEPAGDAAGIHKFERPGRVQATGLKFLRIEISLD